MREAAKAGAAGREEWLGAAAVLRQRAQVTWALEAACAGEGPEAIVARAMSGAALGEAEWKGTSAATETLRPRRVAVAGDAAAAWRQL